MSNWSIDQAANNGYGRRERKRIAVLPGPCRWNFRRFPQRILRTITGAEAEGIRQIESANRHGRKEASYRTETNGQIVVSTGHSQTPLQVRQTKLVKRGRPLWQPASLNTSGSNRLRNWRSHYRRCRLAASPYFCSRAAADGLAPGAPHLTPPRRSGVYEPGSDGRRPGGPTNSASKQVTEVYLRPDGDTCSVQPRMVSKISQINAIFPDRSQRRSAMGAIPARQQLIGRTE